MLHFIQTFFSKETASKELQEIPRKMDFKGADEIRIVKTSFTMSPHHTETRSITDIDTILKIQSLLSLLPKKGDMMKSRLVAVSYEVTAYTTGSPVARIRFYDGDLQSEDSSFYGHSDAAVTAHEAELFEIIKF